MKLLSVDDHLIEPPHVWSDRLPKKYLRRRSRASSNSPSEGADPIQQWVYEGRTYPNIGLNAVAGKSPEEFGVEPVRYADMIPGCYDPKARLADMDIDGVHAMLVFPVVSPVLRHGVPRRRGQGSGVARRSRPGTTSRSTSGAPPTRPGSSRWRSPRCGTPALIVAEIERVAAKGCAGDRPAGQPDQPEPAQLPHHALGAGVLRAGGNQPDRGDALRLRRIPAADRTRGAVRGDDHADGHHVDGRGHRAGLLAGVPQASRT